MLRPQAAGYILAAYERRVVEAHPGARRGLTGVVYPEQQEHSVCERGR